jgi:hypothetical protein
MIPHRLSTRKNGNTPLLKGIPNVTPELKEIIQSVCQELGSLQTTIEYLGQMTRALMGMMGRYRIRAEELLFDAEEMEAASFGYNPGIEADVARFRAEVKDRRKEHGIIDRPTRAVWGEMDLDDPDGNEDFDDEMESPSPSRAQRHAGSILDTLDPKG